MKRAVVLMSGGLDSTVCATVAAKEYGRENVIGLSIKYGQRHSREVISAIDVKEFLQLSDYLTLTMSPEIFEGSGSSLLGESNIPDGPYPDSLGPLSTYVPFRNGTLLSLAAAVSQRYQAQAIYFGAHSEDAANWAYPDCTPEFIGAMANAIYVGTYFKTRLITPLQWLTKAEIVKLGLEVHAPMWLSWSCYRGGRVPCGTCPTCLSRKEAFRLNGLDEGVYIAQKGVV